MTKFCKKCGNLLDPQTGFCPVCGSAPVSGGILRDVPLEQPAPYVWKKRTARFCSRCGGSTDPQTGYCPVCGVMSQYTPPQTAQPAPQLPPQEKKRSHAVLWIVTLAAVLLAAAAVVGVLEHFRIVNIPAVRKLEERMGIQPYAADAIYDDDGALLGYEVYKDNGDYVHYDASGALDFYSIGKYDADGQLIEQRNYDGDGMLSYYETFEYDSAGRDIKYSWYNSDGTLEYYNTYEYDAAGRDVKWSYHDGDGVLYSYMIHEYNSAGQRIRILEYDGDGVLQATYDDDWNLIS